TADELAARFNEHVDVLAKETGTLEANGDIAVSLAVRSDLEQKLTAKVNEISLAAVDASLSDSLERTMIAVSETPANIFAAQVREKSRSLATTRERLDSALALDLRAENGEEGISILAAMRQSDESDVSENTVSPVLFLTKQPEEVMLMSLTVSGTSTATTTATTTEGEQATSTAERDSGSPASRFFLPFRIR
ncbi:MAG: hypothetical protein Q8K68_13875, partial [Nitrospirota bacterium]|nr:hypothetical protein [Nitrospirota bacterium]